MSDAQPPDHSPEPARRPRAILVVDARADAPKSLADLPLVEAPEYLSDAYAKPKGLKVVNLCSHSRSLSLGYYVSLLAEARRHRVLPEAKTLHAIERLRSARESFDDLDESIQRSLRRLSSDAFDLSVYFGRNLAIAHENLARKLYARLPCPLARYRFSRKNGRWRLAEAKQLGLRDVPSHHLSFVEEQLRRLIGKRWSAAKPSKPWRCDLAILANPSEPHPPSDAEALRRFGLAAARQGVRCEIIGPSDLSRLMEFDALFIRETTRLDNHTMRFATKADRSGMPVIDDPTSIRRCCNKVYLSELLKANRIPAPNYAHLSRRTIEAQAEALAYPIVVKVPDGSFSKGVFKAASREELVHRCKSLFPESDILLAQEFMPTDFDWRIGILEGRVLYACRYFMSAGHWQIYNHASGATQEGDAECVPIDQVPAVVIETALKAAGLVGSGLYGVDLKERDGLAYVIEVNDNPSIDANVEDALVGDRLYDEIVSTFLRRLEDRRDRD